jgi:peptidoglycan/xylan/chitin deacetylase (PgdA/CDA1 family)
MAGAGVPYLLAVLPRLADRPLDPRARGGRPLDEDERQLLAGLAGEGVTFALHGLDHRTRRRSARRRSELVGLGAEELDLLLDEGEAVLAELDIRPRVFVAPYNRFDARQWATLAGRYDVVCGGPETVVKLGLQPAAVWRGDAVYLPAYPYLYGRAANVGTAVEALAADGVSLWTPVVLHWGVECDDGWAALEELAPRIARFARPWSEFLAAVQASR